MDKKQIVGHIFLFIILTAIVIFLNRCFNFLSTPCECEIKGISYDFFTIDSVIAGFSFTVLGILLSLHSKSFIEKLRGTDIVINKARGIIKAMIYMCISGVFSLIIITFRYVSWFEYIYIISLVFLALGFIYFVKSMYGIYGLIRDIYTYEKQGNKSKSEQEANHKQSQQISEDDVW